MKRAYMIGGTLAVAAIAMVAFVAADAPKGPVKSDIYSGKFFKSEESDTDGSVNGISYHAVAGTLVVHESGREGG